MGHPYTHTTTNEDLRADNDRLTDENRTLREQCSLAASQKRQYIFFRLLCCLPLLVWATVRIYAYVDYRQHFYTPLKTAIETNDVETAHSSLVTSLNYIDANGNAPRNTSSVISDLDATDYNIGIFKSKLVCAIDSLNKARGLADSCTAQSEADREQALLKSASCLRISWSKNADNIPIPNGLSVYPYNKPFFWFGVMSGVMALLASSSVLFLLAGRIRRAVNSYLNGD